MKQERTMMSHLLSTSRRGNVGAKLWMPQQYRQGFSLVVDDICKDSILDPCLQSLMTKLQVKAKVVTPIVVKDRLWGLIITHQSEPRSWQHQHIQFLRQLGEYFAIAIFNHQSYQQLQQQKSCWRSR